MTGVQTCALPICEAPRRRRRRRRGRRGPGIGAPADATTNATATETGAAAAGDEGDNDGDEGFEDEAAPPEPIAHHEEVAAPSEGPSEPIRTEDSSNTPEE